MSVLLIALASMLIVLQMGIRQERIAFAALYVAHESRI